MEKSLHNLSKNGRKVYYEQTSVNQCKLSHRFAPRWAASRPPHPQEGARARGRTGRPGGQEAARRALLSPPSKEPEVALSQPTQEQQPCHAVGGRKSSFQRAGRG